MTRNSFSVSFHVKKSNCMITFHEEKTDTQRDLFPHLGGQTQANYANISPFLF